MVTTATQYLNVNQVYQLLLNNGANQNEAATLAGISVWEAGGGNPNRINTQALNPVSPDYSVGLFQYNFRAGNFNPSNPMSSTRGGFSAQDLMDNINAQAQSALALLRGSPSGFRNWTTYSAHLSSIQGFVSQLLGTGTATTTEPPAQSTTPTDTGTQTTVTTESNPSQPTSMNLSFADSIQHSVVQILLVLVGIALLLGGIYLIGSKA